MKRFVLPTVCRYATFTGRPWAGTFASCTIVECRAPRAIEDATSGEWRNFGGRSGVRFACDEKFRPIPGADYLHVRSRVCNSKCPFFKEKVYERE